MEPCPHPFAAEASTAEHSQSSAPAPPTLLTTSTNQIHETRNVCSEQSPSRPPMLEATAEEHGQDSLPAAILLAPNGEPVSDHAWQCLPPPLVEAPQLTALAQDSDSTEQPSNDVTRSSWGLSNVSSSRRSNVVASVRSLTSRMRWRRRACYTSREFERTLYDIEYHTTKSGILKDEGIIAFEGQPSPGLVRCCGDWRAQTVDVLMVIMVCISCILSPMSFIFGGSWLDMDPVLGGRRLLTADLILDIFYGFYLIWLLNVSILDPSRHREVVSRSEVIRRRAQSILYLSHCLSVTAYFWISCAGAPTVVNCVKIVRVTHVFGLPDSFWKHREGTLSRTARFFLGLVLWFHWVACLLSYMGEYNKHRDHPLHDESYHYELQGQAVNRDLVLYVMAFVEAVYMLIGSMDNPLGFGTVRESKFGSLMMVAVFGPMGCVVISCFMAVILREHEAMHSLAIEHEKDQAFMVRALQTLNIPHGLRERVFHLQHFQRMGHDCKAFQALFCRNNLSPALDSALKIYLYHDNVLLSPYFIGRDTNYLLEIIRVLEEQIFLPGDYVIRRGEIGSSMHFVVRGDVSVLVPKPDPENKRKSLGCVQVVNQFRKGGYFGEVALVQDRVRTAWVRADTYVLVALLARAKLKEIWRHWPDEERALIKKAADTALRDRQRTRAFLQSKTMTSTCSSEPQGNGSVSQWSRKFGFASFGQRREGQENQQESDMQPSQTSMLLGRLGHWPTVTFEAPGPPRRQMSEGEQTVDSNPSRERSQQRSMTNRSNVSRAISEAAKLCGEDSDSSSQQEVPQFVDASTSMADEVVTEEPLPMQPAVQEPPEPAQRSEDSESPQACMIQQLSALVQGQGELQQQVAELVTRLAAFEEATVVVTAS